jgi:hydrogenase expression/formation protein HypC
MCLAIPCKVVEIKEDELASVQVGESETFIDCSLMLLETPPQVGEYVLVHAGFAINVLEQAEAEKTLDLIREMAELTGELPLGTTAFDLY